MKVYAVTRIKKERCLRSTRCNYHITEYELIAVFEKLKDAYDFCADRKDDGWKYTTHKMDLKETYEPEQEKTNETT